MNTQIELIPGVSPVATPNGVSVALNGDVTIVLETRSWLTKRGEYRFLQLRGYSCRNTYRLLARSLPSN